MTFIDPFVVQKLVDALEQSSRKWDTRADLEKAVAELAELGKGHVIAFNPTPDPDFLVLNIDWKNLLTSVTNNNFTTDMKQKHGHACALNAVRFVLQKRYDVMIGQNQSGDRLTLSLIDMKYYPEKDFIRDLMKNDISLQQTKDWLSQLGIKSRETALVTDIAAYSSSMLAQMTGMVFVAGDLGADHTYVMYEFRTVRGQLEAMIYNPFAGKNLQQAGSDWYDVQDFQETYGLPLLPSGKKIPKLDASGQHAQDPSGEYLYLRPHDPDLASHAPLTYSVMFVPAL